MKRILIFLLLPLPYLAAAQVAKDTVTVLTMAQIPVQSLRDTTPFPFVQDGQFRKTNMDSIARFARVKLAGDRGDIDVSADGLTWTVDTGAVDSTKLAAGAVVLPGAKVTGTLPVGKGGTGQTTLAANKVLVGNGTSGINAPTDLHYTGTDFGVGLNSPQSIFHVHSSTDGLGYFRISDSFTGNDFFSGARIGYNSGILRIQNFENNDIQFFVNYPSPAERMRITSAGEMWIGYTADQGAYRLQVADSVYVGGNVSASAYTTRSDYELKENIQDVGYGINEVMQLQPVKYTYKSSGGEQLGFIAQDLGVILPEVVSFEDKMSVFYNSIIPVLTKAIQEQQAQIEQLKQRITQLENK